MNDAKHPTAVAVTAFTDLTDNGAIPRRSAQEYLRLGEDILSLQMPMVIFCDDNLHKFIAQRRRELCPDHTTVVHPIDFTTQWEPDRITVDHLLSLNRPAALGNRLKDTTDYVFVGWSKWHWMATAAKVIPADGYWWFDFGLTHVARVINGIEDACSHALSPDNPHNVILISLEREYIDINRDTFESYINSSADGNSEWLQRGSPTMAGGIFGVRASSLEAWCNEMERLRIDSLSRNIVSSDQMLLSWYAATHLEQTRVIPSQYEDLLTDFVREIPVVLARLDNETKITTLANQLGDGWSAMNPSIASSASGEYLAVIRHVNYRYDNGEYITLDDSRIIKTRNVLVRLDHNFSVIDAREIDDTICCEVPQFPVHGLEDVRLFSVNNQWMISASIRQHRSDGVCEILLGRLDDNVVTSFVIIPSPLPTRHEKNWMPLHQHSRCEWLWNVEPPVRIVVDDITDSFISIPPVSHLIPTTLRGGSQLIFWRDAWLCVVHDVVWHRVARGHRREYRHYFARISSDLTTVTMSRPFLFEHSGIEFCAGISPAPTGVVVSYGVEDAEARLMVISDACIDDLFSTPRNESPLAPQIFS